MERQVGWRTASDVKEPNGPVLFLTVALKPLVEEVLFRGLLYDIVAPRSAVAAVVITSLAFATGHWIGHGDLGYALAVAPLGLVLGGLRAQTKGLSAPLAFHVVMNAILV